MKHLMLALAVAALIAGIPLYAHHSFSAYYFERESVSIEGELVEFDYQSPHAWVHLMVKDARGQLQKYSAEWANPSRLKRQNITKDTLKPGDIVVIVGSPGRNPEDRKVHLKGIVRPADGWKWGQPVRTRTD